MALQSNIRNKQKSKKGLIILLVATLVVLGLAFAFLYNGKGKVQKRAETIQERPKGMVAVPMIVRNIPIGGVIAGNSFRVRYYRPTEVPTDAVISLDQFLNRRTTRPMMPGEYIHVSDIAAEGAPRGFSGLVNSGKRIVVLSANNFPGSLVTLSVGDHVDILSIGTPTGVPNRTARGPRDRRDSNVSVEGGGIQPGDQNSVSRQRARERAANARAGGNNVNATTATLIAEDAKILATPKRGLQTEFIVLQMNPQDAHVTTLSAASGATMRLVFRPFNDSERITDEKEPSKTTRYNRAEPDPNAVTIITGGNRATTLPLYYE